MNAYCPGEGRHSDAVGVRGFYQWNAKTIGHGVVVHVWMARGALLPAWVPGGPIGFSQSFAAMLWEYIKGLFCMAVPESWTDTASLVGYFISFLFGFIATRFGWQIPGTAMVAKVLDLAIAKELSAIPTFIYNTALTYLALFALRIALISPYRMWSKCHIPTHPLAICIADTDESELDRSVISLILCAGGTMLAMCRWTNPGMLAALLAT